MNKKTYTIAAVENALEILELIAQNNGQLTLSEIAKKASYNKSKTFRILHTMEDLEYVQKNSEEGHYALGERMIELGSIALGRPNLPAIARPHMRKLLEKFGESVLLGELEGVDVIYLEFFESTHRIRISPTVCPPNTAHNTSEGKAILAYLPEPELSRRIKEIDFTPTTVNTVPNELELKKVLERVRETGIAIDDEETTIGVRCVGAPIFDSKGYPVAAMSVEAPTERLSDERIYDIGYEVLSATQACSRILGYTNASDESERNVLI
jgi:DNA-binding IclR family transcriptional regulator